MSRVIFLLVCVSGMALCVFGCSGGEQPSETASVETGESPDPNETGESPTIEPQVPPTPPSPDPEPSEPKETADLSKGTTGSIFRALSNGFLKDAEPETDAETTGDESP